MRPAFAALWDGLQWVAKTNDPDNQQYDLVDAQWPVGVDSSTLPVPRFGPGARVRFKWGDGYLQGTILEVKTYFDMLEGKVVYQIKEIGHQRTVYDDGDADIKVLQQ